MDLFATLVASGTFSVLVSWILKRVDKHLERKEGRADAMDGMRSALKNLMYDRIKHIAKSYIMRGSCTLEEYEDLKRLHKSYHDDVGGNGFLDDIMEDVSHLPKTAG